MEEFYASLPPTLHQGTENFLPLGTASVSLLPGPVSFRKDITSDTGVSSALTSFFRRHWFSRTWILQEVILLRKPVVMCGNATAPWAHVVATAAFLNLDPRDKIFGLLGLVEKFSCRFSRLSSYSQRSNSTLSKKKITTSWDISAVSIPAPVFHHGHKIDIPSANSS
jgi:hypothetical protein